MAVLSGTSRTVLAFIAGHWVPLIQLSLVPMGVMLGMALLSVWAISSVFGEVMALQSGADVTLDPAVMRSVMRAQGLSFLANLLSGLAMAWLFVRVVRYYALGELNWASFAPCGVKPVLLTILYGIGIALLTVLVYIAGVIALAVVIGLTGAIFLGSGDGGAVLTGIVAVASLIALVAGIMWFSCRFAVGLPAVALGQSPDFFREMWPLARGEGWGLPLRFIGAMLVFSLVTLPVLALSAWPFVSLVIEEAQTGRIPDPSRWEGLLPDILLVGLVGIIIQIPWLWFSSLLLAEAYRRFSRRPGAPAIR